MRCSPAELSDLEPTYYRVRSRFSRKLALARTRCPSAERRARTVAVARYNGPRRSKSRRLEHENSMAGDSAEEPEAPSAQMIGAPTKAVAAQKIPRRPGGSPGAARRALRRGSALDRVRQRCRAKYAAKDECPGFPRTRTLAVPSRWHESRRPGRCGRPAISLPRR